MGFPGGLDGKESTCKAGHLGSIPGLGRSPGGGHGNPLQYSCLENSHGQKSLVGYSSWGRKESDRTERLSTVYAYYKKEYKDSFQNKEGMLVRQQDEELLLLSECSRE